MIMYLLILAASLIFASYHGGPVSFAWLYAVLLIIPFSVAYIFLNYHFLRIFQEIEVHRLVRDEDHSYRAVIENAGLLPIHKMRLFTFHDRCDLYEIRDGQMLSLKARQKTELHSGISCKYAGSYDVGIKSVGFSDPFSVFSVDLDVPYTFRAVVSPRITTLADSVLELENRRNSTGLKSDRLREDIPGSDMRPYQQGDPLHSINWKVSARYSEWVVRVPDLMEKRSVTILMLAANAPADRQDLSFLKNRDYFLEFAVSAAWNFARQGVPVRIIYPAGKVSETVVDSYESFMDFYKLAADGIFYSSQGEFEKLRDMLSDIETLQGNSADENGTRILIREDPGEGENQCDICG
ncbi:MAG: DUF58 domain-containing protein [Lachnospiraceae bacterium]|nr:DUF58 domain-containing protein [Lachnospiraceae bacterium]